MFITNATDKKLRFSERQSISEDEDREAFAHVIASGCGMKIEADEVSITIEEEEK